MLQCLLLQISGFNVEDLVIDLFYWYDKSTKRKACQAEYYTFCDLAYREIVKHVNTRWLSLERAVGRVLQQYDGLKSNFCSEGKIKKKLTPWSQLNSGFCLDERVPRFRRLTSAFEKPLTEVYLLFYQAALQTYIRFNAFLQWEDPLIPVLYEQIASFLRKLATNCSNKSSKWGLLLHCL